MKKFISYLFDPNSTALDWLWGLLVVYIPLALLTNSVIVAIPFLFHMILIFSITLSHFPQFFRELQEWVDSMQNNIGGQK